jgi:hypothetical protein
MPQALWQEARPCEGWPPADARKTEKEQKSQKQKQKRLRRQLKSRQRSAPAAKRAARRRHTTSDIFFFLMNNTKATHYADAWATATREKGTREPLVFGKPDQEPVRDPGIEPGTSSFAVKTVGGGGSQHGQRDAQPNWGPSYCGEEADRGGGRPGAPRALGTADPLPGPCRTRGQLGNRVGEPHNAKPD